MKIITHYLILLLLISSFWYCSFNSKNNVLELIQKEAHLKNENKFALFVVAKNDCFNCYKGFDDAFYKLKKNNIPVIFVLPEMREIETDYILQNNIGVSDNVALLQNNNIFNQLKKYNYLKKESGKTFLLLVQKDSIHNNYKTLAFSSKNIFDLLNQY